MENNIKKIKFRPNLNKYKDLNDDNELNRSCSPRRVGLYYLEASKMARKRSAEPIEDNKIDNKKEK